LSSEERDKLLDSSTDLLHLHLFLDDLVDEANVEDLEAEEEAVNGASDSEDVGASGW